MLSFFNHQRKIFSSFLIPKKFFTNSQAPNETKRDSFRDIISEDSSLYQPESGRYHLYIGHGCPFAHRTSMTLKLKGLQDHIGVSVAHPTMQKTKPEVDDHVGYVFRQESDPPLQSVRGYGSVSCKGCIPDTVNNFSTVRQLYEASKGTGRYTIPVLWDKKHKIIVNNESSDIVRIFNSAFNKFAKNPKLDLYPEALRSKIDEISEWTHQSIILGVYKVGYAKTQEEYETAFHKFFNGLDRVEEVLSKSRYLCGNNLTEIDIKLFATLIRVDEAYHVYYNCNKKRIVEYPNILNYCRDIYQIPGIAETVNIDHIKAIYFTSPLELSPYSIIPIGPNFEGSLKEKHDRDRF